LTQKAVSPTLNHPKSEFLLSSSHPSFVVRGFVKLRWFVAENKELSRRIVQIEWHLSDHDEQIIERVKAPAIKQPFKPDLPSKKRGIDY
jgi:hypothetical protein